MPDVLYETAASQLSELIQKHPGFFGINVSEIIRGIWQELSRRLESGYPALLAGNESRELRRLHNTLTLISGGDRFNSNTTEILKLHDCLYRKKTDKAAYKEIKQVRSWLKANGIDECDYEESPTMTAKTVIEGIHLRDRIAPAIADAISELQPYRKVHGNEEVPLSLMVDLKSKGLTNKAIADEVIRMGIVEKFTAEGVRKRLRNHGY